MVVVLYLVHYDKLLQNATEIITKCVTYPITKCSKICLLKYVSFFIAKCKGYYKMWEFYYKCNSCNVMLQSVTFSTYHIDVIGYSIFYH